MNLPESRLLWQHPLLVVEERSLPSGERRLVVHRGSFAAVCLFLYTDEGEGGFLVVKQIRPTADTPFYEHPAGMIGGNESPLEAALRELAEETGWLLSPHDLISLTPEGLYPSPAFWNEKGYFFAVQLRVPAALLQAYLPSASRQTEEENLDLLILTGTELLCRTRNLQTVAHTLLYYAYFSSTDRALSSCAPQDPEEVGGDSSDSYRESSS